MKAIQAAERGGYEALRLVGNEGAGVVVEDPSGRLSAGERVLFFAGPGGVAQDGTFAEMTSVPSGNLARLQAAAYAAVLPLIASGEVVPAYDRSFPLEQAPEALRHLIEDRPFGKVTLSVAA